MKKKLYTLLSVVLLSVSAVPYVYGASGGHTELLSENFAKFSSGSFGAPDENNDISWAGISDYTQTPGWDGEALYAAGGSCYIGMAGFGFYPGYLVTAPFDGSVNEGTYIVSFRACGIADDDLEVKRTSDSKETVKVSTEWKDYAITFTDGAEGDKITFTPVNNPLYIDDIVIYYEDNAEDPVTAPEGAVLFETFDAFSEGTEAEPVKFNDDNGEIPAGFTSVPGWKGKGLFQAGGCAYFGHYGSSDDPKGAYLDTPVLDLSGNGGCYTVKFKAREYDFGFGFGYINIGVYDATTGRQVYNNYADITSEWGEASVEFTSGLPACYLRFTSGLGEAYIDNIAVVQPLSEVEAPRATGWTEMHATGFTVGWNAVDGADSYLLSVYRHENTKRAYLLENQPVDGTSFTVENADISAPYYYAVKTVQGDKISNESNEVRVLGLVAPELLEPTEVSLGGFTANWKPSDRATAYVLTTYLTHRADDAGDYVLVEEDFDAYSGGSLSEPVESSRLNGTLDDYISRAGWSVGILAYTNSAIALDNRYISDYGTSWLHSPVYNPGNGTLRFTFSHRGIGVKRFNVVLRNSDGSDLYSKEMTAMNEWLEDKIEIPVNGEPCYVSVEVPASEKGLLFIDSLRLTLSLAKDEEITLPYYSAEVASSAAKETLSKNVVIADWPENDSFSYSVKSRRVYSDSYTVEYIYSLEPEAVQVVRPVPDGLVEMATAAYVKVERGTIAVTASYETAVCIYDVSGRIIFSGKGSVVVRPDSNGVFIVKVGTEAMKVSL